MGHEIYRTPLSKKFAGKSFSEVAWKIYSICEGGIIFAIELELAGETVIRLNPGNYKIPDTIENNVHVYIICPNKKIADRASTFGLSNEELNRYNQNLIAKSKQNSSTLTEMQKIFNKQKIQNQQPESFVDNTETFKELRDQDSESEEDSSMIKVEDEDDINNQDYILHEDVRTP